MTIVEDGSRDIEWRELADTIDTRFRISDHSARYIAADLSPGRSFAASLSAFLLFMIPQLRPSTPTSQWTCSRAHPYIATAQQLDYTRFCAY